MHGLKSMKGRFASRLKRQPLQLRERKKLRYEGEGRWYRVNARINLRPQPVYGEPYLRRASIRGTNYNSTWGFEVPPCMWRGAGYPEETSACMCSV
jgi:hypothetical protein